MPNVIVHGNPASTYGQTCMITLQEKGIDDYENLPHGVHTPEQNVVHPWGKVPAVTIDDFHLYETLAITQYVDRIIDSPALQPTEPRAYAKMIQWISTYMDNATKPWFVIIIQRLIVPTQNEQPNEDAIAEAIAPARKALTVFEEGLGEQEFFVDGRLTLADLFLAPPINYLSMTPEGKELLQEFPSLRAWFDRMMSLKSVQAVFGN